MKTAIIVVVMALVLVAGAASKSTIPRRALTDARVGSSANELKAQMTYSKHVETFIANHHWMVAARHSTCWSHVPWAKTCNNARILLKRHQRLEQIAHDRYQKLYGQPLVAHLAGWECITNGAYPGAAHEGNGYNGAWTGPLGMTTPWAGYSPRDVGASDWVHANPIAVYAIAEKVAAAYDFSYSFMSGQWPNTYPPCANLF